MYIQDSYIWKPYVQTLYITAKAGKNMFKTYKMPAFAVIFYLKILLIDLVYKKNTNNVYYNNNILLLFN